MVEVVPCVALPPGARQFFTYRVPAGADAPIGSLVRIPFGQRTFDGVVWRTGTRAVRRSVKTLSDVVSPGFLLPKETVFLERLAELSLESLALLTKSLVAVRRPGGSLLDFSHPPTDVSGRTPNLLSGSPGTTQQASVACVYGGDPAQHISSIVARTPKSQVLILVPELSLAEELDGALGKLGITVRRFAQTLPLNARRAVLRTLAAGEHVVVIATHSGVFLPFPLLRGIVVVEPGLPAHRQWDLHPRYDARLAALLRAEEAGVPLVFIGSLPSLDLQSLSRRRVATSGSLPLPTGRVLRRDINGGPVLLPDAERAVKDTLERGQSVFLFQNIVGAERYYVCAGCGFVSRCAVCGSVLHRVRGLLTCPACGSVAGPVRSFCPRCGSPRVAPRRVGTAALQEMLEKTFPSTPIVRLDRGSVPRTAQRKRTRIPPSLVIGTERAFTILPLQTIQLSVIIDADQLLTAPTYDAAETALRIIARVAALTAPPHDRTLLVQTAIPDFPLFRALAAGTMEAWVRGELADRQALGFPPFAALLTLTRDFPTRARAEKEARALVERVQRRQGARAGMRFARGAKTSRSTVTLRGARKTLWQALPAIPRSWTIDPFVPLRDLL